MGREQPYLYDRPSSYTESSASDRPFNPKAVTEASWAPSLPRPRPSGPLIESKEMNKHPDSYVIVPYGNLNWKPMSTRTKSVVKTLRFMQLGMRVCELLGAAGLMFCVICIKATGSPLDWVIRIPPGIAILHCVYAIYHLSRSSKCRTPASSASYMIFAAIFDASIIPFLAYTALNVREEYYQPMDLPGHWQTLLPTDDQAYQIFWATWLICLTDGGLHLASLIVSLILGVIYRKIASLPPDMNPLEDNLTSRHKRNKSSLSISKPSLQRDSQVSFTSIEPPRAVPFLDTRNNSTTSLATPQWQKPPRPVSASPMPADWRPPSTAASSHIDVRDSGIWLSQKENASTGVPTVPKISGLNSYAGSIIEPETDSNWISHPTPSPSRMGQREATISRNTTRSAVPELQHLREIRKPPTPWNRERTPLSTHSPQPLGMNPPTPPVGANYRKSADRSILGLTSGNSTPAVGDEMSYQRKPLPPSRSNPYLGPPAAQNRHYGDMRNNMPRNAPRVVSSGVDVKPSAGVRVRDVSGKGADDQQPMGNYHRFF